MDFVIAMGENAGPTAVRHEIWLWNDWIERFLDWAAHSEVILLISILIIYLLFVVVSIGWSTAANYCEPPFLGGTRKSTNVLRRLGQI